MMTVNEVSRLTSVSIRALHYYDQIGLLARRRAYRQRLTACMTIQRWNVCSKSCCSGELEFSLKDIQRILSNSAFDREKALEQQIELLKLKRQHIEDLIALAEKTQTTGGTIMDFTAFDTQKIKDYAAQAKQQWGATPEYKEFEQKTALKTEKEVSAMGGQLMEIIAAFGKMQSMGPAAPAVQAQVKKLQGFYQPRTTTPAPKPFWASSASCTPQAARLPKTSTPPVAPVPPSLPARRSRCIAGRKNKAVQVTQ